MGQLNNELSAPSLPQGLSLKSLSQVLADQSEHAAKYINQLLPEATHGFMELNTAFVANGVWLEVDENANIEQPIELMFISTGQENSLVQPRNILIAHANSQVKVVERYLSLNDNKTMTNSISEIHCAENAKMEHVRVQQESRSTNHISGTFIKLKKDSHFSTSTITLGAT